MVPEWVAILALVALFVIGTLMRRGLFARVLAGDLSGLDDPEPSP